MENKIESVLTYLNAKGFYYFINDIRSAAEFIHSDKVINVGMQTVYLDLHPRGTRVYIATKPLYRVTSGRPATNHDLLFYCLN